MVMGMRRERRRRPRLRGPREEEDFVLGVTWGVVMRRKGWGGRLFYGILYILDERNSFISFV